MCETTGGCIRPNDSFILKEPIFQNVTSVSLTLLAVISHLKWSSVNVIYDDFTGYIFTSMFNRSLDKM